MSSHMSVLNGHLLLGAASRRCSRGVTSSSTCRHASSSG